MRNAIACICAGLSMSIATYLLGCDLPYIAVAFAAGFTIVMEVHREG